MRFAADVAFDDEHVVAGEGQFFIPGDFTGRLVIVPGERAQDRGYLLRLLL